MKNLKFVTLPEIQQRFSTLLKSLWELIYFRISPDGTCFNPDCSAIINDKNYRPIRDDDADSFRKGMFCRNCLDHFYMTAGSYLEWGKLNLMLRIEIIFLMCMSKNGISCNEVCNMYGQHLSPIFKFMHKVREQMGKCLDWTFADAVVEVDESYVMTSHKGLGKHYPHKRGRGSDRKTNVLCIAERTGRCKMFVIRSTDSESIIPIISKEIDASCLIVTDDWGAYDDLKNIKDVNGEEKFKRIICNHSDKKSKYKQGNASTNNNEGIFSILKGGINGTYRAVKHKYLQNYLNEFSFRYSFRNERDYGFSILMRSLGSLSEHYSKKKSGAKTNPKDSSDVKFPHRNVA